MLQKQKLCVFGILNQFKHVVFITQWRHKNFQGSRSHYNILGARWVTWGKLHTWDPPMLGSTVYNLVAQMT